ncbi:MAG: glutaredoxin family protein [Syntrophobacterales bacterium]|jgi:glutaredoxin 3|nr:glutaredoxin family protein [Syntrophobacterales bacterium]
MTKEITIFGKKTCPFTRRAREAKSQEGMKVIYRDVQEDGQALEEMLRLTQGNRRIPVMLEGDKLSIGFGGS